MFVKEYLFMRIAVVGSRNITAADVGRYVSDGDGKSRGTLSVIRCAEKIGKTLEIVICR